MTFLAAFYVQRTTRAKDQSRFEHSVQQMSGVLDDRLDTYEALLRAGAGFFAGSDVVTPEEFHQFVSEIDLPSHYKGIQGLGFSARLGPNDKALLERTMRAKHGNPTFKVWPAGDRPEYFPVVYLEPRNHLNEIALGYDMFSEGVRRAAIEQARDTNSTVASGRVTLIQERDAEQKQSGFLIYMPVYGHGAKTDTVQARRAALIGFVYAPFRAGDLMRTILSDKAVTGINYKVFDGPQTNPENLLYDSAAGQPAANEPPGFQARTTIGVGARPWTLEFSSTPEFEATKTFATLTLLVGAVLSFVLYGITRAQTRTQRTADTALRELRFSDRTLRQSLKERKEAEAAVLRSREELLLANYRFRVAEEASNSFNYDWNLETDTVIRSDNFSHVLGYEAEDIAHTWEAWKQIAHPDDFPISKQEAIEYLNKLDGDLLEAEYRVRHKNGTYRNLYNRGIILRDENGKARRVIGQTVDITEHKLAQAELLAANERYRELFENANDIVYTLDLSGNLTSINKAGEKLIGSSADELVGQSVTKFLSGESVAIMGEMLKRKLDGEKRTDYEVDIKTESGKLRTLEISSRLVSAGGEPGSVQGIARDITERKVAEEQLRVANERAIVEYEHLLERIDTLAQALGAARELLPIYRALKEFVIASITCNGLFISLYDPVSEVRTAAYAWGDGIEHDVSQLPPMPITTEGPNSRAVRTGDVVITDDYMKVTTGSQQVIVGPENNLRPQSSMAVPMALQGRIVGTIEVQSYEPQAYRETQATAMRMAANLTAVAIENARLLGREMEARAEAEESNRLKDEFLATVSHELRTPLTAILGWARMMDSENLDPEQKQRAIQTIQRNAKAQAEIVDDILDVSRIITGNLYLSLEPTELTPIIEAAINVVRPTAEAKRIVIETEFDPEPALVSADHHRMQQVVWNVVSNAIKFTPAGGRVRVRTFQIDGYANVEVTDTGQGITAEFLPHVFERFRQADSSTTRLHGGLGLGLAIVRHLIEIHGGSVRAESEGEGKGATFTITLPLLTEKQIISPVAPPLVDQIAPTGKLQGVYVLLVDDDPDTREVIAAALNERQVLVTAVASAREALMEINRKMPDVLISDIAMPVEDGYQLLEQVRAFCLDKQKQIPAIAITAYARDEDRSRALAAGYHNYLAKPIEPTDLIAAIFALMANGAPAGSYTSN
jgi:PAS domain S-box-containing protein